MSRSFWIGVTVILAASVAGAQERRPRIAVDHYAIDAEINPDTQSISAKAAVPLCTPVIVQGSPRAWRKSSSVWGSACASNMLFSPIAVPSVYRLIGTLT